MPFLCLAIFALQKKFGQIITYSNRIELVPIKPIKNLKGMLKGIDANIMRDEDRI
jgi:hypothetical protein